MRHRTMLVAFMGVAFAAAPVHANGYGEDAPWQFQTPADQANLAAVQSMIQQKKAGMYHAPNYNYNTYDTTNIGKQVNCGNYATAYGNYGQNSQGANSPSINGASASSSGNASSSSSMQSGPNGTPVNVSSEQSNTGTVTSGVVGGTDVSNGGPVSQALNSTQTNSGTQTATISNSTACSGALN